MLAVLAYYVFVPKDQTLHFCFIDAAKKEPITSLPIDITILNEGESPTYIKTDSLGCFSWSTKKEYLRFVAQSPYHKTDTIYKKVKGKLIIRKEIWPKYSQINYHFSN